MPSFQQTPVAYSSLLAAIQKEQRGSCKKWGVLPPRCPTFPFCVILCKGAQSLYFCARHPWHYCTYIIHVSMGYRGHWVPCWDPRATGGLWGLVEWSKVILQHHPGQKHFYGCLPGQRGTPSKCQRWELHPWPKDLEAAYREMGSVKALLPLFKA